MAEPDDVERPPHAGERLTREDVERLIEEHGGPEGLDLREADLLQADLLEANLQQADLREANLQEASLFWANLQGANLRRANLQGANLWRANLQDANLQGANLREAFLQGANLQEVDLSFASLQGADLRHADLRRARLADASLRDANLEGANWGDYMLGDEIKRDFAEAASAYRALKQRHTETGMYDIAGEFFYREMEARRKSAWRQQRLLRGVPHATRAQVRRSLGLNERRRPYAVTLYALRFLYGYGERPLWVIGWAVAVILGLAFVYLLPGVLTGGFRDALYYSAVSFTALGYGWAAEPQGWAGKFLGVGESLLGVFMMALFLVTFTRKMTR